MTIKFLKTVLTTCRYAMCISLTVLSVSGTASATLIESIAALEEGAMYRVLFATSTTTQAISSDIAFYNSFVSTAADSGSVTGSLGLSWKALASTAADNVQDHTGIQSSDDSLVTMFNTLGEVVAVSGEDLWDGDLNFAIGYDVDGAAACVSASCATYTGFDRAGMTYRRNHTYLGGQLGVIIGFNERTDSGWANVGIYRLQFPMDPFRLYAVSSEVMKTSTVVTEPGTVILLSLGLAGLAFARYRKQY
jgi:hypothetical protein